MIGQLLHSGFISSLPLNKIGDANYDPWYVLQSNNELISFIYSNGNKANLNSLFIEAENTNLYINIGGYILYVPANESREYNFESVSSIQVMNNLGVKLRWSGLYF